MPHPDLFDRFIPPSKSVRLEKPGSAIRGLHGHPHWEVGCVLHGRGTLVMEDRTAPLTEGDTFVLSPRTFHQEFALPNGAFPVIAYAGFRIHRMPGCPDGFHAFPMAPGRDWRPLFVSLARELADRGAGWEKVIAAELEKLFVYLGRPVVPDPPRKDPVRDAFHKDVIAQWKRLVEHHGLRRDFRLAPEGQVGPFSQRRFQTLFKNETGMTCKAWVMRHRLERARHLLEFGPRPLTDIAETCGFTDVFHFTRAFKKYTGVPPARYRMGASRMVRG